MVQIIDQRSRRTKAEASFLHDAYSRSTLSAKFYCLCLLVILFLYLKRFFNLRAAKQRQLLQARRRAGIPDSDTRPFRIAFVEAEQRRLERDKETFVKPQQIASSRSRPIRQRQPQISIPASTSNTNKAVQSPVLSPRTSRHRYNYTLNHIASPPPPNRSSVKPEVVPNRSRKRSERPDDSISDLQQDDKRRRLPSRSTNEQANEPTKKRRLSEDVDDFQEGPPRKEAKKQDEVEADVEMSDNRFESKNKAARGQKISNGLVKDESAGFTETDSHSEGSDVEMESADHPDAKSNKRERDESEDEDASRDQQPPRHRIRVQEGSATQDSLPLLDLSRGRKLAQLTGRIWQNLKGESVRLSKDGQEERLVRVKDRRKKYNMDSKHPDRDLMETVWRERWVSDQEYLSLKRAGLIMVPSKEIGDDEDGMDVDQPRYGQANRKADLDEDSSSSENDLSKSETSIFFAKGSRTPLYHLSPRSSSTTSLSRLANGRIRLPSNITSGQMTPRRSLAAINSDTSMSMSGTRKKRREQSIVKPKEEHAPVSVSIEKAADVSPAAPISVPSITSSSQFAFVPPQNEPKAVSLKAEVSDPPKSTFAFGSQPSSSPSLSSNAAPLLPTAEVKPAPFAFSAPSTSMSPIEQTSSASRAAPSPFGFKPVEPSTQPSSGFSIKAMQQPPSNTAGFSFKPSEGSAAPNPAFSFKPTAPSSSGVATSGTNSFNQPAATPFAFGASTKPTAPPSPAPFQFGSAPAPSPPISASAPGFVMGPGSTTSSSSSTAGAGRRPQRPLPKRR